MNRIKRVPLPVKLDKRMLRLMALMRQTKNNISANKDAVQSWLKGNRTFNPKPYIRLWQKTIAKHKTNIVKEVVSSLAMSEAFSQAANDVNMGLGMPQVSFDFERFADISNHVFVVQMTALVLKNSNLPQAQKQAIWERMIAREFPTKDNVHSSKQSQDGTTEPLIPYLEQMSADATRNRRKAAKESKNQKVRPVPRQQRQGITPPKIGVG